MIVLGHKIIGNGPETLILIHDLMSDSRNYLEFLKYIDINKFTIVLVDLRGYGLSKDIKGSYTYNEASNDIKNLILSLKLKNIHLLAHSMSTMIAQNVLLLDEININTLILISPILPSGIKLPELVKNTLLLEMNKDIDKIEDIVYSSSKRYNKVWAQQRIEMAYSSSILEARVGYMSMYLNSDFTSEINNIQSPIKIIVGKYDFPIFGLNQVEKNFKKLYKNIEIIQCQEAGHYVMIECPVYFANKVESFIFDN